MNIENIDIFHLIIALFILMLSAHTFSYLFRRFKQPEVIGEILAGLILGPTLLSYFFPEFYKFLFVENKATSTVLGFCYQFGLLHLMFCAGLEVRAKMQKQRHEGKTVIWIVVLGMIVPFMSSFLFLHFIDIHKYMGTAGSQPAFILIFALAIAITSIPVISRIMYDLKLLKTSFARIVLSAAILEDIVLYAVLTIALGLAGSSMAGEYGLPTLIHLNKNHTTSITYHVIATLGFFALCLTLGPHFFRFLASLKEKFFKPVNQLAFLVGFMFFMSGVALFLDLTPMFGAFTAGIIAQSLGKEGEESQSSFKFYSFAFFIPIYFAIVGLRLDLIHEFNILFFLIFLLFACAIKSISVYAAARFAGEKPLNAFDFAVAMNARGGPGIVLASLGLDSKIINEHFYTTLVMLALVTSYLAGAWLQRNVARKA